MGDEITVNLFGQELGKVRNDKVTQAGRMRLTSSAGGEFRDIVYVPLDPQPASPTEPVAQPH